jgi:predicted enzyme related to lactoylglutathione lyase
MLLVERISPMSSPWLREKHGSYQNFLIMAAQKMPLRLIEMTSKVTHFEIPVDNMDRAKKFYSEVFDWKIMEVPGEKSGEEYTMVIGAKTDKEGKTVEKGAINGGMFEREKPLVHPIITIDVEDIDAALDKVKKRGGKITMKKTVMEEWGAYAYFEDSEGNVMGLWESTK